MQWKELCVTILQKCIILPIECNAQDTALTIFSTLNDRGMPLADSDIFKAQIYRNTTESKRKEFTETWKDLTQICKEGHFSIDDIFRYYTHVLRARNSDKSKEVGLRKFYYADGKYERLKSQNLMSEILDLAYFRRFINAEIEPENGYNYSISTKAKINLHCLNCYPNEYWKYATSVFFLKHKNSATFETDFEKMLQKLIAFLFAKFVEQPTVNAIKDDIYNACISLNANTEHQYRFTLNEELLSKQMDGQSSSRISRALLLLYAYLNPQQTTLIPSTFEIEHIFPKKWQDTNYNGWSNDDAVLYLDRFGNKTVIEKKLNIQAGNGYFGVKKQQYKVSSIATVVELSNYPKNDWIKEDIELREANFKTTLSGFFRTYLTSSN